ncbi:MAG: GGDEF domain-containing protein [Ignavibacteriales bacterium]
MNKSNPNLYSLLSRFPFPKSYPGKILLTAFIGMQVPLLILIFYFTLSNPLGLESTRSILTVALLATLVGTAFTHYTLNELLTPVLLASQKLREHMTNKRMPDIPDYPTDQAGQLMADVQHTVKYLDKVIDSLEKASMMDYLTGAYNRHAGENRLMEDIARVQRSDDTMSLVMLDVDDLKLINDQYGHDAGDICLKHVASTVKGNIRKSDWLARWGGDEFVLLLFNTKEEPSAKILERICTALKENPIHTPQGDEINLTLSMGVYQYNGRDDIKTLLIKMDNALYGAKRGGKDQIVYYGQEYPGPVQLEFLEFFKQRKAR